jgi:hypothetical protein
MTHIYMPIGREGWALSAGEVRAGVTRGERFCLCRQRSDDQRLVYHDTT